MVSQKTIASLPEIASLRRLSQSLALLEAILCPQFDLRYYAFNSKWGEGEIMASMNNGGGDDYFILFNQAGAIIKGFDHESSMSPHAGDGVTLWQGVLDEVPAEFRSFLVEPAFTLEDTTFCLWRRYADSNWQTGRIDYPGGDADADGSGWMLPILKNDPSEYRDWAEGYHDQNVNLEAVEIIYAHQPLVEETVKSLNAGLALRNIVADIEEIGYPSGAT